MITLDESQQEFVRSEEQNIRLLAPAGCGKTTALLYRCLELARRSPGKPRFLIVTFTKAAAAELKERLVREEDFSSVSEIRVTTLNAYGWQRIREQVRSPRLLTSQKDLHFAMINQLHPVWGGKQHIEEVVAGRGSVPRILMDIMDNMKSLGFDHTRDTNRERFKEHINWLSEQGLDWRINEQLDLLTRIGILAPSTRGNQEGASTSLVAFYDRFFTFWRDATSHLLGESTFTFEDQKYWTFLDIKSPGPDGQAKPFFRGVARYDHILVDEFQDINPLDLNLIRALAERNQSTLTIVGDDDQAIFEWRGASPEYILHPEAYLGLPFEDYLLSINYRSPRNIVDLSQKLISKNQNRRAKATKSAENADTADISIIRTTDIGERLRLVTEIARSVKNPGKVAVIGRLRRQLIPYEIYFADDGAPFKTATDMDIFGSKAFDDLITLLDIWEQSTDRVRPQKATDNAISICNFIKKYPLNQKDKGNLGDYISRSRPRNTVEAVDMIANYTEPRLRGKTSAQLHDTASSFIRASDVADALREIHAGFSGLRFDSEKAEEDPWYIDPPLKQIAEIAESEDMEAGTLIERLETAKSRLREYQAFEDNSDPDELGEILERPLHLMTATRSKGKEFDTVILLDTISSIWPHHKSIGNQKRMEAERRLFYVAFTRARRKIFMLTTKEAPLSPFIEEMGLST